MDGKAGLHIGGVAGVETAIAAFQDIHEVGALGCGSLAISRRRVAPGKLLAQFIG